MENINEEEDEDSPRSHMRSLKVDMSSKSPRSSKSKFMITLKDASQCGNQRYMVSRKSSAMSECEDKVNSLDDYQEDGEDDLMRFKTLNDNQS
jgi:hypothetical protein